jgi:hypothetical protein
MAVFLDTDRSKAPMPADRAAAQPWMVAGRLLMSPFTPREGALTDIEAAAILVVGERLASARRAGRLPACPVFWFNAADGRCTPLILVQAWLRVRVQQHVVVDLRVLEAIGRVVPVQLLVKPDVPRGATTRRAPKVHTSTLLKAVARRRDVVAA